MFFAPLIYELVSASCRVSPFLPSVLVNLLSHKGEIVIFILSISLRVSLSLQLIETKLSVEGI